MSDAMKYEDWLRGCVRHDGRKGNVYLPCDIVLGIADWIEAHRDVAPVRHGRWELDEETDSFFCSECNSEALLKAVVIGGCLQELSEYCPNCGAKMDEEVEA